MLTADQLLGQSAWRTFLELDRARGLAKGAAFKAFKALGPRLVEGQHFYCCDARADAAALAIIRASGRVYPATINAVFLTACGQALVASLLDGSRPP